MEYVLTQIVLEAKLQQEFQEAIKQLSEVMTVEVGAISGPF